MWWKIFIQIIHSFNNNENYSFKRIPRKYSFKWKMNYRVVNLVSTFVSDFAEFCARASPIFAEAGKKCFFFETQIVNCNFWNNKAGEQDIDSQTVNYNFWNTSAGDQDIDSQALKYNFWNTWAGDQVWVRRRMRVDLRWRDCRALAHTGFSKKLPKTKQ